MPARFSRSAEAATGEHPNSVAQLAHELGAELEWQGFSSEGVYDAIFNSGWIPDEKLEEAAPEYYRRFANSPAQAANDLELAAELKEHLRQILPGTWFLQASSQSVHGR